MKHCKHCFEEINKRARVCPVCHRNVTITGSFGAFFVTVLPILTALASLGFAFYEKYERLYAQEQLARTETQLEIVEVRNEVAQDAVVRLNRMAPPVMFSTAPDSFSPENGRPPTPEQELQQVEQEIEALMKNDRLDRRALQQLERRRLELQTSRPLFGGP